MSIAFGYTLSSWLWTFFITSILTALLVIFRKKIIAVHRGILLKALIAIVMCFAALPIYFTKLPLVGLKDGIDSAPFLKSTLLYRIDFQVQDMWYESININYRVIMLSVVIIIFFLVAIGLCVLDYKTYYSAMHKVRILEIKADERVKRIANEVRLSLNVRTELPIMQHKKINEPAVGGFFRPAIFLPEQEWTDEQLRYIFEHEYRHYKNGDAWLKLLLLLIKNLNWWNIPLHILFNCLDQACEHSIDYHVTVNQPHPYRQKYARAMVAAYEYSSNAKDKDSKGKHPRRILGSSGFVLPDDDAFMKERILMFLNRPPKTKSKLLVFAFLICSLPIAASSFAFIPTMENKVVVDTARGEYMYFVDNHDGTFDAYLDGVFTETIRASRGEIEEICTAQYIFDEVPDLETVRNIGR